MVRTYWWSYWECYHDRIWKVALQKSWHPIQPTWRFHMWRVEQEAVVYKTKSNLKLHSLATTTKPKEIKIKCVVCSDRHRVAFCPVLSPKPSRRGNKLYGSIDIALIAWKQAINRKNVQVPTIVSESIATDLITLFCMKIVKATHIVIVHASLQRKPWCSVTDLPKRECSAAGTHCEFFSSSIWCHEEHQSSDCSASEKGPPERSSWCSRHICRPWCWERLDLNQKGLSRPPATWWWDPPD